MISDIRRSIVAVGVLSDLMATEIRSYAPLGVSTSAEQREYKRLEGETIRISARYKELQQASARRRTAPRRRA